MENIVHISDVIEKYISGDWGEEANTNENLIKVFCIRGADINNVNGGIFNHIPFRYIEPQSLCKKCLKEGNIIIEKSGGAPTQSTGRVAYISKECIKAHKHIVCSNFCVAFSIKSEWDAHYIFYYLQYIYSLGIFFNFEGKTSGIRNLQVEQAFANIPIRKISLPTQRKVAELLSALDQKIALNRTINQQLEQLARTIYNYYFLQFHTPLTPLHDTPSRPQHPNTPTLTYNPILKKNIPIGWEVKTLGEVLGRVQSTVKLKTNEYNKDGKYPIIDQSSDTYIAGYTDRQDAVVNKYPVVVFGDHSCSVKYVNFPFCRGADGTQIIFSNDERLFAEYLYFVVKSIKISEGYARHFSLLKSTPIIVPDIKTASLYHKIVTPLFEKIRDNNKEITTLTTYRDALLPLLMNGQVEVKV